MDFTEDRYGSSETKDIESKKEKAQITLESTGSYACKMFALSPTEAASYSLS